MASLKEIISEIFSKGLRSMNAEINEGVQGPNNETAGASSDPLKYTRPGFEKFHPAFYDAPKNNKGMA